MAAINDGKKNNRTPVKAETRSRKLLFAAVILSAAGFAIYILMDILNGGLNSGTEGFVETEVAERYDAGSKSEFYTSPGRDGYFHATKDGIRYVSASGAETMSETYNIANPVLAGAGSVAAVLEKNGTAVCVYDTQGELYSVKTQYPIVNYSVNPMGFVSVILKKDRDYVSNVFNSKGGLQQQGLLANESHAPIATAVSNDGRILAICFLDLSDAEINTFINFYYLNKNESIEHVDGLFTISGDNPGEIIGKIAFMNGNRLIAVSDKSIKCYEPENKTALKPVASISLNNKITAVSFDDPSYFAVAFGDGQLNMTAEKEGLVRFYGLDLVPKGEFQAEGKVNYLYCGYNGAIIGENRQFTAVTNDGGLLWQKTMLQDVRRLLFLGGTSKVLEVGAAEAAILRIDRR